MPHATLFKPRPLPRLVPINNALDFDLNKLYYERSYFIISTVFRGPLDSIRFCVFLLFCVFQTTFSFFFLLSPVQRHSV